jgi:hypothetical protein
MDNLYKVVFRGDIAPGHSMVDVRSKLQELFRLDDQGINKLFVGRPIAIKKNLDEATAKKWCEVLGKAGALADCVAEDVEVPAEEGRQEASPAKEEYAFDIAPVGADVLKPSERAPVVDREISTTHLSLDVVGADVLKENERAPHRELNLDLSHIHLADTPPE